MPFTSFVSQFALLLDSVFFNLIKKFFWSFSCDFQLNWLTTSNYRTTFHLEVLIVNCQSQCKTKHKIPGSINEFCITIQFLVLWNWEDWKCDLLEVGILKIGACSFSMVYPYHRYIRASLVSAQFAWIKDTTIRI